MPQAENPAALVAMPAPDALAAQVIATCHDRGLTLATCESLTAGLVAATLAQVPGASKVLRGGLVTYATDLKARLAGVDAELLAERGAVDPDVAEQMAAGTRRVCGADVGLSCTGVAGPEPQDGKPVGTVFIGLALDIGVDAADGEHADGTEHASRTGRAGARGPVRVARLQLDGDREAIRTTTVSSLFTYLLAALRPSSKP